MVTERQAKLGQIWSAEKASKNADIRWQLVVDELNKKIADLENELNKRKEE